jgi:hypothetical protein
MSKKSAAEKTEKEEDKDMKKRRTMLKDGGR